MDIHDYQLLGDLHKILLNQFLDNNILLYYAFDTGIS